MKQISFIVPGKPCTQGSKDQFGREANKRLPGWRSDARDAARQALAGHTDWPMDAPMTVSLAAFHQRPKHHTVAGRGKIVKDSAPAHPGRVGDLDKIARALLDAMTGIAWNDDDQVVRIHADKLYSDLNRSPRLTVTIFPFAPS